MLKQIRFYKVKSSRDSKYFFALSSTTIVDNVNQFEKPTIDQIFLPNISILANFLNLKIIWERDVRDVPV